MPTRQKMLIRTHEHIYLLQNDDNVNMKKATNDDVEIDDATDQGLIESVNIEAAFLQSNVVIDEANNMIINFVNHPVDGYGKENVQNIIIDENNTDEEISGQVKKRKYGNI